jgi:hypothetical protein
VQYNLSKRYAFYGAMTDLSGNFTPMTYRYAPGTPEHARGRMRQSLGTYVTFGVKGSL